MGLQLAPLPATVGLNDFRSIECDALEGVNGDENNSTVGVDAMLGVTIADGVEDCTMSG